MNINTKKSWQTPRFSPLNAANQINSGAYANGAEKAFLSPNCATAVYDSTSPQGNVRPSTGCTSQNPTGMWNCAGIIVDTTFLTYDLIFITAGAADATILSAQCS